MTGFASMLPAKSIVIEVLESVEPDDLVIASCRKLKESGYLLALDDIEPGTPSLALAAFASIIKVDYRATTASEREVLLRQHGRPGVKMLAEKVETQEEFRQARQEGFQLFQGYFFARPVILSRNEIPAFKLNYLRLLAELHSPELEFGQIEHLIKQEASLCHRLLRYINSAACASLLPVTSIAQALVFLGENELRRWISLAALPMLASDKPEELVENAVLRARFCELIAPWAGLGARAQELFLMGMFSLLDAMVGRPLDELLGELHLSPDIHDALLGMGTAANTPAHVYELVLACEKAEWETVSARARLIQLPPEVISGLYLEAVNWCGQMFHSPAHAGTVPVNHPG